MDTLPLNTDHFLGCFLVIIGRQVTRLFLSSYGRI
ncbi:hypothetical protein NEOC95_001069 [Neochlamydia sp. AcF95]|nr:hypothetical protein [Neochlamydia sp. AcF95]